MPSTQKLANKDVWKIIGHLVGLLLRRVASLRLSGQPRVGVCATAVQTIKGQGILREGVDLMRKGSPGKDIVNGFLAGAEVKDCRESLGDGG